MNSGGTFSVIPNWVIRESDLNAHELLVYVALLNRADRHGRAWPSMGTLAKEARASERSVRRALESLRERQLVTWQQRMRADGTHASNLYTIAIFDRSAPEGGWHSATPTVAERQGEGGTVADEVDTHQVDTDEEDLRSTLASGPAEGFSFPSSSASEKQVAYLRDLYIHYNNAVPPEKKLEEWRALSPTEATDRIDRYLAAMPRYQEYEGPEFGEPTYEALSDVGRVFAEQGMIP
ncbi:helix-turn-helix domain-containing protein [Agromyces sp. CCNWLW203]|uniref:helix-turn-helix domain-containing protein n=1 Tax=Agromyces sp. CCNWLW203 TaxID=3112842 RepID=UPI002F9626DC